MGSHLKSVCNNIFTVFSILAICLLGTVSGNDLEAYFLPKQTKNQPLKVFVSSYFMEIIGTLPLAILLAYLTSAHFPMVGNSFSLWKAQQFRFSSFLLTDVYSQISSGTQQNKFNSGYLEGSRN